MNILRDNEVMQFADMLGAGGVVLAKKILPWVDDPLKACGDISGTAPTMAVREYGGDGPVKRTTITLSSYPITMTDEAGVVAYGGSKIYDMPAGNILIFGATADLSILKSGSGINADFDGDFGLGTVTASNNATLSSTEQNIIPTTATPQAVAGATTAKGINTAAIAPLDGTATAVDIYLNALIDDADQNGGGTLYFTGTITITWMNLGDK